MVCKATGRFLDYICIRKSDEGLLVGLFSFPKIPSNRWQKCMATLGYLSLLSTHTYTTRLICHFSDVLFL